MVSIKAFLVFLTVFCLSCAAVHSKKAPTFKYGAEADQTFATPQDEVVYKSTVFIETHCPSGKAWYGSGVAIGKRYVLTAKHVIICEGGISSPDVSVKNYKGQVIAVKVAQVSKYTDGALLATAEDQFIVHAPINPDKLMVGQKVVMFSGINRLYKPGIVGKVFRTGEVYVNFSPHVFHGDSGSPVFNEDGEVVGVIFGWITFSNEDTTSDITSVTSIQEIIPADVLKENQISN